jgi:hypothetical protein
MSVASEMLVKRHFSLSSVLSAVGKRVNCSSGLRKLLGRALYYPAEDEDWRCMCPDFVLSLEINPR